MFENSGANKEHENAPDNFLVRQKSMMERSQSLVRKNVVNFIFIFS